MLPSWSDRLQIVLAPDRVSLTRLGKGLTPRVLDRKSVPCAAPEVGEALWQPALRVLGALLKQVGGGKAHATVMLSNHFVRYQLIAPQPDLGSVAEEEAFVRFSFSEVYGDEADRWDLRWGSGLDLNPQVASAIDAALLFDLETALTSSGHQLTSLQPYLMAAFNHLRNSVDDKTHWFVLVEPGRVCQALLQRGEWQRLYTARLGNDWATELPSVLDREFRIAGLEAQEGNVTLCLPGHLDLKRLSSEKKSFRELMMSPEALLDGNAKTVVSVGVMSS